jgi:hypothetical protein
MILENQNQCVFVIQLIIQYNGSLQTIEVSIKVTVRDACLTHRTEIIDNTNRDYKLICVGLSIRYLSKQNNKLPAICCECFSNRKK